jgi:cell division protein FtsN
VNAYDVRKRVVRHIDRDPVKQSSLRRNLWRAAVIIPIIALLIAVPVKTGVFKTRVETTTLNPLVTAEFENNRKAVDEAVSAKADSNIADSNITYKEPEPGPEPAKPAEPVKRAGAVYAVITGSFKSENNALSHVRALKAEGFNPEVVRSDNGFFRVYAIRCSDLETALHKKDSIAGKFPGTWITRQ